MLKFYCRTKKGNVSRAIAESSSQSLKKKKKVPTCIESWGGWLRSNRKEGRGRGGHGPFILRGAWPPDQGERGKDKGINQACCACSKERKPRNGRRNGRIEGSSTASRERNTFS